MFFFFFFFQAEDGIRDHCVTGVQTCALPILVGYFSETVIAYWILWSHCELGQEGFYGTRYQCHVIQRVSVSKVRNLRTYTDEITLGMFGKL